MPLSIKKKYFSLDYIIVFLLVLSGGSILNVFNRNFLLIIELSFLLYALSKVSSVISKKNANIQLWSLLIIALFLLLNFSFGISGQDPIKFLVLFLSFSIASLSVLYFNTKKIDFVLILRNILYVIMIHSLIGFFLFPFIKGSLFELTNAFTDYSCKSFLYLFYYIPEIYEIKPLGGMFCRNQGFFWEPGVLQIFLNILLFLDLFILKSKSKNVFLTVLCVITTYSTTGMIILLIQLVVFFWKKIRQNILILPLLLLLVFPFYLIVQTNLDDKLSGDHSTSTQVRLFDLVQQLVVIKENPFLGVGLDDQIYKVERSKYSISFEMLEFNSLEKGSTNSVLFLFAAGGIPFAFYLFFSFFKQQLITHKKKIFYLIFIISVMSEPVLLKPFFLVFIMTGNFQLLKKIS